jgi:hypothetical protein
MDKSDFFNASIDSMLVDESDYSHVYERADEKDSGSEFNLYSVDSRGKKKPIGSKLVNHNIPEIEEIWYNQEYDLNIVHHQNSSHYDTQAFHLGDDTILAKIEGNNARINEEEGQVVFNDRENCDNYYSGRLDTMRNLNNEVNQSFADGSERYTFKKTPYMVDLLDHFDEDPVVAENKIYEIINENLSLSKINGYSISDFSDVADALEGGRRKVERLSGTENLIEIVHGDFRYYVVDGSDIDGYDDNVIYGVGFSKKEGARGQVSVLNDISGRLDDILEGEKTSF